MPDRVGLFGFYGADGIPGGQAVARRLDRLTAFIASPVTSRRGLVARLRYLAGPAGAAAMAAAGITATPRTVRRWVAGIQRPAPANAAAIDQAYRTLRRRRVASHLLRRLNADGGTRIEITPLDQSGVAVPRRRDYDIHRRAGSRWQEAGMRRITVRRWDEFVAAWAEDDMTAMDEAWIDQISDIDSDWGMYHFVSSVGFAA
jgi:hypothetical protein